MSGISETQHGLISQHVTVAFKSLLSGKHLYQSVELPREPYEAMADKAARDAAVRAAVPSLGLNPERDPDVVREATAKEYRTSLEKAFSLPWVARQPVTVVSHPSPLTPDEIPFNVPDIRTFCGVCKRVEPFNPNPNVAWGGLPMLHNVWAQEAIGSATAWRLQPFLQAVASKLHASVCRQLFLLPYQCQGCKTEPLTFFVRRKYLKLTLCGRSHIETVPVPNFLPIDFQKYYSDAHIAHNAGQTLAGIFLLRVFIEQFWRSLVDRKVMKVATTNPRISGEELGAAYNETLPSDFTAHFPSLASVYGKLSECMHTAHPDAAVFDSAADDIVSHFDARRIRKIDIADGLRVSSRLNVEESSEAAGDQI